MSAVFDSIDKLKFVGRSRKSAIGNRKSAMIQSISSFLLVLQVKMRPSFEKTSLRRFPA
jgi:hypothetical protein